MNVDQLWPPGSGPLTPRMQFWIVRLLTRTPSLSSSPRMRSAPHSRFSRASRSMRATVFAETRGRWAPRLGFFRQSSLKPARCHRSTVSGLTSRSASLQRGTSRTRVAINALSCGENVGRFALRHATRSCWRSKAFSASSSPRDRTMSRRRPGTTHGRCAMTRVLASSRAMR